MPGSISSSIADKTLVIPIYIPKSDVEQAIPACLQLLSFKIALAKITHLATFQKIIKILEGKWNQFYLVRLG